MLLGDKVMSKYYYCVNTFRNEKPVQFEGYVMADSERDAIQELINKGVVDPCSYEFLELYVV